MIEADTQTDRQTDRETQAGNSCLDLLSVVNHV